MALGIGKQSNDYARGIEGSIDAPKAVWMAVAVSLANLVNGGSLDHNVWPVDTLMAEWQALYDNGLVQQKPRRRK